MAEKIKLYDKTDFKIIQELSKNARASSAEIAKMIGINERTVRRRIQNLLDTEAIRVGTIVNPSMFGYHSIVDINLKVAPEIYEDFVEDCKINPNICYMATGWGEANLAVQARFLNNEEMYQYINFVLPHIEGVKVINYFIIPHIIYDIDCWMPVESDFKD